MIFFKQSSRYFHNSLVFYNANKSGLAELRKRTGYTFANCKKALELNGNDVSKAEEWLNKQAQSMGWSKATKLENRSTTQGLVGVLVKNNIGAMVEINCETDFVARNEQFRKFVEFATKLCAQYTSKTDFDGDLWKLGFETDALKHLKANDGKTLSDHLALLIGTVGENATLKRAICFKTNNDLKLYAYTHPPSNINEQSDISFGKYGTLVAFRTEKDDKELQKNICQHIVGMSPVKIGNIDKDKPLENKDNETCLIFQEYLLDPNYLVNDFLKENNVEIIDYQRYECGENMKCFSEEN
ncbi:elongation factor Ts, mitochondrial-like [Condylostylus longicornis]|uniref:elongation factor Ts, mitochondrial-like n=1 Tax=Condylostylus longicornis TaxID=2530218 RepID=UPI00244E22AF|nr:elongation factor Ts, mitochondrial-like [Condylostylus longicornis]